MVEVRALAVEPADEADRRLRACSLSAYRWTDLKLTMNTFDRAPLWVRRMLWIAVAALGIAGALAFGLSTWGSQEPRGDSVYPVEFRGGLTIYVSRSVQTISKVSFPIALGMVLVSAVVYHKYRDKDPPDSEGGRPTWR